MDDLLRRRARDLMDVSHRVSDLEGTNDRLQRENGRLRIYVVIQTVLLGVCLAMTTRATWFSGDAAHEPGRPAAAHDVMVPGPYLAETPGGTAIR